LSSTKNILNMQAMAIMRLKKQNYVI
jgi:hypothetical protein